MFRVDLNELDRKGSLRLGHRFPEDDPLWKDSGLAFRSPVAVEVVVTATATAQVVVRGQVSAVLVESCRRCLSPLEVPVEQPLEMVWSDPDEFPGGRGEEADGEMMILESGAGDLDLSPAIREEVLLSAPQYVLCRDGCLGLCPRCGANRNETECSCSLEERDPRWDALRRSER